jgi:hypothetical protein
MDYYDPMPYSIGGNIQMFLTSELKKRRLQMKTISMKKGGMVVLLVITAMALLITNQAFATSNTAGGGNFLDTLINCQATGTPITGTLTLYFAPIPTCGANSSACTKKGNGCTVNPDACNLLTGLSNQLSGTCQDGVSWSALYDFVYIFRVNNANNLAFSGVVHNVCIQDVSYQIAAIQNLISSQVLPAMGWPVSQAWQFKSYGNFVQSSDTSPMAWMMVDVTLAVAVQQ